MCLKIFPKHLANSQRFNKFRTIFTSTQSFKNVHKTEAISYLANFDEMHKNAASFAQRFLFQNFLLHPEVDLKRHKSILAAANMSAEKCKNTQRSANSASVCGIFPKRAGLWEKGKMAMEVPASATSQTSFGCNQQRQRSWREEMIISRLDKRTRTYEHH